MAKVTEFLDQMRASRQSILERLRSVPEEQMLVQAEWAQRQVTVRFLLYRLITHEEEHTVHLIKTLTALGIAQGEAELILRRLQATRGELEGLLVGLSDEDLDRVPAEGEWSVRQVLEHIVDAEERYSNRIEEALRSAKAGG